MTDDEIIAAAMALLQRRAAAPAAPDPTVGELLDAYLDSPELAGMAAAKTERGRIAHLRRLLGDKRAAALTLADVDDYRKIRAGESGHRKTPTKPATRNREVVRLVRILNWAVERKKLATNPIAGAPLEPENNERRTSIEAADIDRLEAACAEYKPEEPRIGLTLWAMIATKFDSGMRRAELCRLRRDQQRVQDGEIHLHARDTKGKRGRVTILSARAADAQRAIPRDLRFADSPFLFLTKRGKPYHPRTFLRMLQEVYALAGIEGAEGERPNAHDLRAGFVGQQLELNTPEREIMGMTGHTSHDVFDRYNRRRHQGAVARAGARLNELHGARKGPVSTFSGSPDHISRTKNVP